MKARFLIACAIFAFAATSCTTRLTDFTVISTKNVPLGKDAANLKKGDTRVKGKDKIHVVLGIPIGTPNMKEAIDKAIEQNPGCVGLVDGVLKSTGWWALLYGQQGYIVEGTPLYEVKDGDEGGFTVAPSSGRREQTSGETMIFFHEVKAGETLGSIASSYGVTVSDLIKWNELSSTDIAKGTRLKIRMK